MTDKELIMSLEEKKMTTVEKMKLWAEENMEKKTGSNNGTYFKPEVGKNVIRLLPCETAEGLPIKLYFSNYVGGKYYTFKSKDNPFSARGWELHNEYKDTEPDKAKEARQKWLSADRVVLNIYSYAQEKNMLWQISKPQMDNIIEMMDDHGDFFDVDNGRDLTIKRDGTGLLTKYTIIPAAVPSKLKNADDVLKQVTDLDDWFEENLSKDSDIKSALLNN